MVTKQIKQKQADGTEITLDIGAKAENVETDSEHQFVTAAEKEALTSGSEAAQSASDKIGTTGDTGGSASAGTVMAKLNKLISDLATHMSRWSSTRAGYIDTINTNAKNSADRIGAAGDSGGSTSAGTVMGKLNKLLSDLASHVSSWSSTRASYIDTIKTSTDKIGAAGDTGGSSTAGSIFGKLNKLISDLTTHMGRWTSARAGYIDDIRNNTAVNNTASATGTLSQKLSYIASLWTTKGMVKSVQSGIFNILEDDIISGTATQYAIDIEINAINPQKSIVIIEGTLGATPTSPAILESLTSTTLRIGSESCNTEDNIYGRAARGSWQVIEFY